jgi:HlyD family secretion protein
MSQAARNLILALFVVALFGLATLLAWSRRTGSSQPPARSGVATRHDADARTTVAALGRLEPAGGVIDVGGTAGERVDRLAVAEGDQVRAGQELAFLGSYPLRLSERQLAEIQLSEAAARGKAEQDYGAALVAEAQAALELLNLADFDAQALRAKIDSLELNLRVAERDLERVAAAGEVVSAQEQDHQQLVVEQAKAELNSTRAQLIRLEASREAHEHEAQARFETAKANQSRLASAAQLQSLEKALATATQKLDLAVIRAPCDGRILRIVTRAGETIGPRPLLELGDTEHMYATAEVFETDVRFLRKGQSATVTSDALSAPLKGVVESIGTTVAKNEVASLDPTAAADARVVLARIRLDESREAAGLVDLQVDVVIDTTPTVDAARAGNEDRAR